MSVTNRVVNRRPQSFYIGKVLYLTGSAVPYGCVEGYYVPIGDDGKGGWEVSFVGFEKPEGVPIYIHDGRTRDLKAIPSTVLPGPLSWLLWPLLYLVLAVVGSAYMYEATWFLAIICFPIALVPFGEWFYNVEPVRATKVGMGIFAVETGLAARRHFENKDYLNHNQFRG